MPIRRANHTNQVSRSRTTRVILHPYFSLKRNPMNQIMTIKSLPCYPHHCPDNDLLQVQHFKTSVPVAVTALLGNLSVSLSPLLSSPVMYTLYSVHLHIEVPPHDILHEGHRVVAAVQHHAALSHHLGAFPEGAHSKGNFFTDFFYRFDLTSLYTVVFGRFPRPKFFGTF